MRLQNKFILTVIIIAIMLCFLITPISSHLKDLFQVKKLDAMSEHYLNDTLKKTSISSAILQFFASQEMPNMYYADK